MAYLDQPFVQAFLEQTKAQIVAIDSTLDLDVSQYVLSQITVRYDTTTWTDEAHTPSMVRQIMAMRYAGIFWSRQYGEDLTESTIGLSGWGGWLLKSADSLIALIVSGALVIPGAANLVSSDHDPLFFPTDAQDTDGLGNETKFTMARIF